MISASQATRSVPPGLGWGPSRQLRQQQTPDDHEPDAELVSFHRRPSAVGEYTPDTVALPPMAFQPRGLKADLEAALEHIPLHLIPCRLDERQCRGAHLHHIADDVALHLVAQAGPLLWRRRPQELVPQRIDLGVFVVDLIRPQLTIQEV